jgi:hypothetical protein
MVGTLFIVAVRSLEGDAEDRARALARVLGLTLFETRARVQPPAPRVIASFAERAAADRLATALAAERFDPLVLAGADCDDAAAPVTIRGFLRQADAWHFEARDGWTRLVRDDELRLLLKVGTTTTANRTDKATLRRFSLGKAVLTGGLAFTKKETVETTTTTASSEASVYLYAEGHPPLVFHESDLQFQGLGPALQPTRQANWLRFVQELRGRTPAFDDRLANRAGQNHVLGGVLSPERYLDVALALLARSRSPGGSVP